MTKGPFQDVCPFCLELHRGACLHPDCPIGYTGDHADAISAPPAAPEPTQPSLAGSPPRRVRPPTVPAQSPPHVMTQPSIVEPRGDGAEEG